ncbi:MAG TPA: hypothetical protein PLC61_03020 [Chitinophagales bacterium]|nr:hypothetical protein [Chitinophagales bacterium]MCB0512692.1 hypothetical protein [Bacteroidota bacterium]MCB9075553.1 hypothetical protein [Chitinophagales bacterium]HMU98999.1 hypothetical protein [Chitinophagales bacterium]HMV01904.1 hypothetical protein [Chitinophagales bacterium]
MAIPQFNHLAEEEVQLLLDAPAIITLLIGTADGNMDDKEIAAGLSSVIVRKDSNDALLQPYYEAVDKNYDQRLFDFSNQYKDKGTEQRTQELSDVLAGLNDILIKVDPLFVTVLIKSLKSFAKEIAQASGGMAGIGLMSISNEEEHLISLPMITIK